MSTTTPPLTADEARAAGHRPLAGPYGTTEHWMLARVQADLARGNIPHVLVQRDDGQLEVWRTARGWLEVVE